MDAASDGNPAERAAAKEAFLGEILLTRGTPGEDRNPFRGTLTVRALATLAVSHADFDDPAADAQLLAVVEAGAHLATGVGHFGAAAGYGLAGGAKTVSLPSKARATEMRGKPASDVFVSARLSNEAPLYGLANAAMNAAVRVLSEKPEDRDIVLRKLR